MRENVIFTFPGIALAPPHSASAPGLLQLASSQQQLEANGDDIYLRLRHTPDDPKASHPTDVLIEAWRELRKTSPREFLLASEFGDITITFPELHHLIPQSDPRVDLPAEAKLGMQWEAIVREFEAEVDRFVSYRKNSYSLLDAPFGYAGGSAKALEAEAGIRPYNPSAYPSEKAGGENRGGRLVLVDEENGAEVGEVGGMQVNSIGVVPGSKDPVEITFPTEGEGGPVTVRTADYLKDASHPMYQNSSLVQTAATASRLIVTTSSYISNAMQNGARSFAEKTKPNTTPTTFQPSTHERFQQVHTLTSTAAKFSSVTVGKVSQLAQNAGARLAGKGERQRGDPKNPGILNKSLIAFSTVADSIDYASKSLLTSTSQAATHIVAHKYGAEAGELSKSLTGAVKNVGLVYIDASGVSRRAIVKGVAKGMVVGKVRGGGEVIVPPSGGEKIDGLPYGWGDGPLGGPYAGPPSGRSTPVPTSHTPPPNYAPGGYTSLGGAPGYGSSQFPPPNRALTSPPPANSGEYPQEKNGYPSEKPNFRF